MALALLINQNGKATYQNGSKTMSKQYKDFKDKHPLIYRRILECHDPKIIPFDDECRLCQGFPWPKTLEGVFVWADVDNGYYDSFYDFHKALNPEKEYTTVQLPTKHLEAVKEFIKQLENQ
jgi:hypothetical protein